MVAGGMKGELYIGGANVGRCYEEKAERTAERFIPNPEGKRGGERLYRTGDLARYQRDGNIEYIGRIDNQVKIRGYRVEPAEIEAELSRCEGVSEAVVIVRDDDGAGKRLVGYVVGENGQ